MSKNGHNQEKIQIEKALKANIRWKMEYGDMGKSFKKI